MKITPREELLMRRALDPASSAAEAETAAQAFVRSLRKRGINGYDFVSKTGAAGPSPQPHHNSLSLNRRHSRIPSGISCVNRGPTLSEKLQKIRRRKHRGPGRSPINQAAPAVYPE
jgi:hypothetical protein